MPPESIVLFGILLGYTMLVWGLGFHYGAKSFKDRNKAFLREMKKFNENRNPQSQWFQGYQQGISAVLTSLDRFLDGFRVEDEDGTDTS